jgi:uncharacterized protein YqhQ
LAKGIYGGQAVIEGVMVRGKRFVACAVRAPQGNLVLTSEPLSSLIYASRWAKIPFLRAVTIMWDTIVLGTRMLMFSANIAVEEEPSPKQADQGTTQKDDKLQPIPVGAALGTAVVALVFGIGLFFVLPLFLTSIADPSLFQLLANSDASALASNLLEGFIRLFLLFAYIYLIGLAPDVRRVFQYHGAEHKTIAADEADAPLTPNSIQKFSKEHPRCGTGFLLTVVVVSVFVFALLGKPPIFWRVVSRIVLIPVVVALSYELIKLSSAHRDLAIFDWLVVRPSLALQSLTTREPDDRMVEVAVAALLRVKSEEGPSAANGQTKNPA